MFLCKFCRRRIRGNRYILRIASYAAYDGLEINPQDLRKDFKKQMDSLIRKIRKRDKKSMDDEVCAGFEFTVCKNCRERFIRSLKKRASPDNG